MSDSNPPAQPGGKKPNRLVIGIVAVVAVLALGFAAYGPSIKTRVEWEMSKFITPVSLPTPSNFDEAINEGNALTKIWELDAAIAKFDSVIQADLNLVMAYVGRAKAYLKKEEFEKAKADIDAAYALDPKNIEVILAQGDHALVAINNRQAEAVYNKAIGMNDQYALAYVKHGTALEDMGEFEQALADYEQAIELDPNLAAAYEGRADVSYERGEYESALADLERAIKLDPGDPDTYTKAGDIYVRMGNREEAIKLYTKANEIAPHYPLAYAAKAANLVILGKYQEALDTLNTADTLDISNPDLAYWRGTAKFKLQQYEAAEFDFLQATVNTPDACAYMGLCATYVALGHYEAAVYKCTTAVDWGGVVGHYEYFMRARAYDGLGSGAEALDDYRVFVQIADPESEAAKYAQERIEALSSDQLAVCSASGLPDSVCPARTKVLISTSEQDTGPLLLCGD